MQNAKDSFYVALKTRLTAINPERTILLRSAVRPGILVEEAEAPFAQLPADVLCAAVAGLGVDQESCRVRWLQEGWEVLYSAAGDTEFWRSGSRAVVAIAMDDRSWWRC